MKSTNRDLLVLSKKAAVDKQQMELEVEMLNQILFHVESISNFCIVNEIIDINTYKIITNPAKMEKMVKKNQLKAFQFINNKN